MGNVPAKVKPKAPAKVSKSKAPAKRQPKAEMEPAGLAGELDAVDAEEVIEGEIVVDPDLVFTTPQRDDEVEESEAERTIAFEIDGETYKIVKPRKFPEVMRRLIAATSRRASEADTLWAGEEFLERVLAPESIRRLNERLNDDDDPFREEDLYDILTKLVEKIGEKEREKYGTGKARARARGRR